MTKEKHFLKDLTTVNLVKKWNHIFQFDNRSDKCQALWTLVEIKVSSMAIIHQFVLIMVDETSWESSNVKAFIVHESRNIKAIVGQESSNVKQEYWNVEPIVEQESGNDKSPTVQ